jgi:hypothetical protein
VSGSGAGAGALQASGFPAFGVGRLGAVRRAQQLAERLREIYRRRVSPSAISRLNRPTISAGVKPRSAAGRSQGGEVIST